MTKLHRTLWMGCVFLAGAVLIVSASSCLRLGSPIDGELHPAARQLSASRHPTPVHARRRMPLHPSYWKGGDA
jgi:hypothetical protein